MSRSHIEFIQAQALPWRPSAFRPGTLEKRLSQDAETGAFTAILRYPAGWSEEISSPTAVEEGFILRGGFRAAADLLPEASYYFWPGSSRPKTLESYDGGDVLTFFDPKSSATESDDFYVDTPAMDWSGNVDPNVVAGSFGKKVLREDPVTGERVWLLMLGPGAPAAIAEARIETHPHVEEVFLLDGEITMPMGVMQSGGYIWRPGGIPHGPIASVPGCLGFFRSVGGPMTTDWSEQPQKVNFDPPYAPIAPDDLKLLAQAQQDLSEPY